MAALPVVFSANGTFQDIAGNVGTGSKQTYSLNAFQGQIMSVSILPEQAGLQDTFQLEIKGRDGVVLCPIQGAACLFWRGSRLRLHQNSAGVLSAEMAITSASNYQRFCSSFMAAGSVGFRRPILFTNEEATDFVSPPPLQAWPATPGNQRQAGLVVAQDARNGKTYEIPGMGRMNHENTIFVPGGWDKLVAVTGDDTFSAPSSQFYMYVADSDDDVLADNGSLYAFVADNPALNDYGDITSGMSVSGHFIPVPREIALGDQAPLENWSNANNVIQFIRIVWSRIGNSIH